MSSPPLGLALDLSVEDDTCQDDHRSHQDHQSHHHTNWKAPRCCVTHGHMIIQDWDQVDQELGRALGSYWPKDHSL